MNDEVLIEQFNRLARGIIFFRHRLSDKQFLIVSSIVVGLLSGGAAVILKSFVHSIQHWIERYSYEDFFLVIFFPLVGIAFTVLLINTIWKTTFKKGSAEITYAITKKSSQLPISQTYSHIITSAITVGFGGSTGLESPMVSTGSAIGSNVARAFRLSYKEKTILLACGAAAGIAAAFNSPIAGVLFAIEVLLADISAAAFIPLIIAAATGALLAKIVLSEGVLLTFTLVSPFDYHNTHYYLLLGLLSGFVALYYAKSFVLVHDAMKNIKSTWLRVLIGGVLLAALVVLFPSLLGEGYESIKSLSNLNTKTIFDRSIVAHWVTSEYAILLFLGLVVLLKSVAAAITIGSGGNGGSFGPSLFMGAYLGFVFARLLNMLLGTDIPEVNFALVGMAGMLSGVFYAPLTAIFLIAEITGGYGLIIPLMIVSAISLAVANYFEPKSMDDNLDALRRSIAASTRNTFAVVNDAEELVGIIQLDDVRQIIFSADATETLVKDLMNMPAGELTLQDNLQTALKKFDTTGLWNLPVVDKKRYVGFISKSSLLARYRNELIRSA
ncbi:MAG: chloride channel protein [Cytophagia bacterium]|nr:chloride channel protein [Cytophagia bacterium]